MRKKAPSQKVPCARQNCCGASNQHDNYLSVTSRGQTRSHSKKKSKKTKKKDSAIKQILQQSYSHLKQQNQELQKRLTSKKKKIQDLKIKLKQCEDEIKRYQQLQKKWIQGNQYKTDRQRKGSKETNQEKHYAKLIQDSHNMAKQTLERYKKLEQQYSKYRQSTQKKMDKLRSQKQRIITEGTQRNYNKQIQELKQQLNRFKQDQITASSLKNLHQNQHNSTIHQEKLKLQITTLKASVSSLKSENNHLKQYVKELEQQLEERTSSAQNKQRELKNNLDVINSKINNWERDYKQLKEQSLKWENEYNALAQKYQRRKQKYKMNNSEWAQIFKQFIHQIDKLKQQLDYVSQRNVKLIKMYGKE